MSVPLRKRLRRRLRGWLLRVFVALAGLLPLGLALAVGRRLGAAAWRVAGGERRNAEAHLRRAFPEADEAWIRATGRACFVNLGEHALELLGGRRLDGRLDGWVEPDPQLRSILDAAVAEGRGVLVLTGHIGNWELAARALVHAGYDFPAVARKSHDPGLERVIEGLRAGGGVRTIQRGEPGSARALIGQFRRGSGVFMLVDLDTRVPSVFVPFFGHPAKTARGPADLALRTGAAIVTGYIHRKGPGQGHRLTVRRLDLAGLPEDPEAAAVEITARFTRDVEAEIRRHPTDWIWMHRRWRSAA